MSRWQFVARTRRPVPLGIVQDPGTVPFSASNSHLQAKAIPRSRSPRQDLSRMTVTHDSHDPENDHDTGIGVAIAYSHPQITHAPATSCPMCTCAHSGRR